MCLEISISLFIYYYILSIDHIFSHVRKMLMIWNARNGFRSFNYLILIQFRNFQTVTPFEKKKAKRHQSEKDQSSCPFIQ